MNNNIKTILFAIVFNVVISTIYPVNAEEAITYVIYELVPILLPMVIQKIEKDNTYKVIPRAISLLILLYTIFILGSVFKDIYPLQMTEPFYYTFYVIIPKTIPVILNITVHSKKHRLRLTRNLNQRNKNKEDWINVFKILLCSLKQNW